MLKILGSHVRGNVVGYIALFVALGGTAVAANGDNFKLGLSNSAGNPTQLTSPTTDAAGALKVTSTASSGGRAIQGTSANGQGVYGHSGSNAGIVGDSNSFDGVFGVSHDTASAGVSGHGVAGGYGIFATGGSRLFHTAAIHGQSGAGNGIEGISTANPASGVYGQDDNANSYGVAGHSNNGVAVVGDSSNGWSMQALGNTTQARSAGGFVKAMAFVNTGAADPIKDCFNSQVAPSQARSGDCGMSLSTRGTGEYDVDFGFNVSDRVVSVTSANECCTAANRVLTAFPFSGEPNKLEVTSVNAHTNNFDHSSFYIVVF
jgi:hypothetical protein